MDSPSKLVLFEQCIVPHLDAAYNLARWLTRNEYDAEDIVQEAYLRAFRFFDSFNGGDGKAWLLAIVRNTCLTWRRRAQGMPKVPFDEGAHSPRDAAANAETGLVEQAQFGNVRNCLESLPIEFREVLARSSTSNRPAGVPSMS